ncbi:MAG: OFA family MFS transporter [Eubacterium sp.]|nr:OFA family MFS transporter [Eubacterium sp.]
MEYTIQKKLTKKRWLILAASCLINLCIGSLYAWSVFAGPLAERINMLTGSSLTAANLAIVFTVANAVGPITMISGGTINDKLGPKWVIFAGGLLFGLGLLACGFAGSVSFLIVAYGLGCGLGMGMVYGCTISNSVKFFPDKRGLIGGIATATYGLSSVLIPPVANALIGKTGVSSTMKILGAVFTVVICVGAFFIEKCPADFTPEGWKPKTVQQASAKTVPDKTWKEMITDPIFYVMILMLMCGAFSGLMVTSQASPMAQQLAGMSVGLAATAVSVLALFNAAGRVAAGFLSDRFGRVRVLQAAFLLEIVGLLLLLNVREGNYAIFFVGISVMGICFGSLMGVYPGFTADQFGTKNSSVNYGIMFIGFAVAGILGPTIVSKIVSAYGIYTKAFYVAAGLAAAGIILSGIYQKLNKK